MIVLLCEGLERLGDGLDLGAVTAWLAGQAPSVEIRVMPGACQQPEQWLASDLKEGSGLVLGLCSLDGDRHELDTRARKLGLDPFALQVLDLGSCCALVHPRREGTEKAKLLLAGAVARSEAYPGSRPENAKPILGPRARGADGRAQQVSRRSLFSLPSIRYDVVPSIREEACTAGDGCRICARSCPREALVLEGGRMTLTRAECTGCGACVSACPRSAIELPGASLAELEAQLAVLLAAGPHLSDPRGILFHCPKGAGALDELARKGLGYPSGWLPVEVPCLGMVTAGWVLHCLNLGAEAVGLLPCRQEECRFGQRGVIAGRADYCRALLGAIGGAPDSVRLLDPADVAELGRGLERLPTSRRPSDTATRPRGGGDAPGGGLGGTARSVVELAERLGKARDVSLAHPYSPLGSVRVSAGCTGCWACASACPTGALAVHREGDSVSLGFDPSRCVGCEECVPICPERVVHVDKATDLDRLSRGERTLYRDSEARCQRCGSPVAPRAMLDRIAALLGDAPALATISRYCLACRGTLR